jgi:CheY-like chemotaxis protein
MSAHSPTILVVEDEPVVRNILVKILVAAHYRVFEADSEAEAFAVSEMVVPIDLLIVDHALKRMSGRQVAEHIRQTRPGLKVLHVSGYPLEKLLEEEGLTPGADFLPKPFLPKDLIEKVRLMLGPS